MQTTDPSDPFKQAMDHAWDWFSLHAKQRMDSLNFFLITTAFLSAAYGSAVVAKPIVSAGVAVVGCFSTIAFAALESRSRTLIRLGESALDVMEARLSKVSDTETVRLVHLADESTRRLATYTNAIRVLHGVTLVAFVTALVYAINRA